MSGVGKYTLELRHLIKDSRFDVFGFDYPFYSDDEEMKKHFEDLFIAKYFFHEINSESVARWKHQLQAHLTLKMPYYRQLYESELKSKDIDFLLNKDLTETFTRTVDVDTQNQVNNQMNLSSTNELTSNNKRSTINDGVASVSLNDSCLTDVNQDIETTNDNQNSNSQTISSNKDKTLESTTFVSRGNVGVTSSAELLEKWRSVMINLNELVLYECRHLFLTIY